MATFVTLIHNNDPVRLAYIRPALQDLKEKETAQPVLQTSEIQWQDVISPQSVIINLVRAFIYRNLSREWSKYRLSRRNSFLRDHLGFLKFIFASYVCNKSSRVNSQRNGAIELQVTAKHIRSWESFVESSADYLVVFEDDVRLQTDSLDRYANLVSDIDKLDVDDKMPLYVDLAGGLSADQLDIEKLELSRDGERIEYKRPVTNTACGYLINKATAQFFVGYLIQRPWLRWIGCDWLINKLFIEMEKSGVKCLCWHYSPSIFHHGSFKGVYSSWCEGSRG